MQTKAKVHRFTFFSDDLNIVRQLLNEKGYNELPSAIEINDEPIKIVADNDLKHFWEVSQSVFENSIPLVKNRHNEEFVKMKYNEIKDI